MGLSAGTGLGVSAALVSNNGTTPNLDNNNAPPAAAEVPPPPPGAPPEPQHQGEGNGVELQAPSGDIPQNDVPVATSSRESGHHQAGSAELSPKSTAARNVGDTSAASGGTVAGESTSSGETHDNATSSTSSGSKSTVEYIQSKPLSANVGCVTCESDAPGESRSLQDVPTPSQSQVALSGQQKQVSSSANRTDIDRYASACHGGPLQHNSTAAARGHGSGVEGRPSALQIQLADNRSESERHIKDTPQFHLVNPGSDVHCGKGKSLIGSRKGVVKRSQPSRLVHQSCQAVSEEIRQSTKKAKEGNDIGDAIPCSSSCQSDRYSTLYFPIETNAEGQSGSNPLCKIMFKIF